MQRNITRAAQGLFDPRQIGLFIGSALVLSVMGNALFTLLTKTRGLGDSVPGLLRILFLAGVLLIVMGVLLWLRLRAQQTAATVTYQRPQKQRGLIVLVSRVETAAKAIAYHLPVLERCWLICSDQSKPVAESLSVRPEFRAVTFEPLIIENHVFDPRPFRDHVAMVYEQLRPAGWDEAEIITDVTGMTALASIGSALACLPTGRRVQYVPPVEVGAGGTPSGPAEPMEIVLS